MFFFHETQLNASNINNMGKKTTRYVRHESVCAKRATISKPSKLMYPRACYSKLLLKQLFHCSGGCLLSGSHSLMVGHVWDYSEQRQPQDMFVIDPLMSSRGNNNIYQPLPVTCEVSDLWKCYETGHHIPCACETLM